jgi:ABC-type uncharacterized transport system permease subunit
MNSLMTISIEQGLIFAVLAMGVFITYKIFQTYQLREHFHLEHLFLQDLQL